MQALCRQVLCSRFCNLFRENKSNSPSQMTKGYSPDVKSGTETLSSLLEWVLRIQATTRHSGKARFSLCILYKNDRILFSS